MELHVTDKNRKTFSDNRTRKTGLYENTIIGNAGVEITESQHTQQVEHEEGLYEKLRFERKFDEKETKQAEDEANRLKCVIYVIASMLIVLYIGVIIAIIIISRQTQQVDGIWAPWSNWTSCDVSCGNGTQARTRKCSNPAPSNGGADCIGHDAENVQCIRDLCADGRWSNWERWSTCSLTCGGGIQTRSRSCTNPKPSVGGQYCTGDPLHVQSCNISRCPIDGNWAHWSTWSSCDVSCDNGTQIRTRTCTHPPSANGGADCIGQNTEHMPCTKGLCPVHGSWATWSDWGSCSSTCDIGIQRRDRSCSNPYPSRFGDYCYGESRDDRICLQQPCADGGWTNWENWSTCSVSCGGGIQSRSRSCTNPKPSILGQYCIGDAQQTQTCSNTRCQNGGWTNWGSWSTCSQTCGGGIYSRSRTCTNPKPSDGGEYCIGNPFQVQSCSTKRCPPLVSAFSVDHPYNYSSFHGTSKLTFSNTIYQHGGDFDKSTGTFICSIPGTYHFSVTLVKKRATTRVDYVYCYLSKNGSQSIRIEVDPTDDDTDKGSAAISQSVVFHLNKGNTVYLSYCIGQPSTNMEFWSSFTGFLLSPDN